MNDQALKTAFEPISIYIKDGEMMRRMEVRSGRPDLWSTQWDNYPALLMARNVVSRLFVSYCSDCPNIYLLPEDEIQAVLWAADVVDSINMAEFLADMEDMLGVKISDEFSQRISGFLSGDLSPLSYQFFLDELLKLPGAEKIPDYVAHKALMPLTYKTDAKDIRPRLELRADQPDLWSAMWPDAPRLLEARDRASRLIRHYSKNFWPNVFFLPDDSMRPLIWGEADSLDMIEIIMEFEEVFDVDISHEMAVNLFQSNGNYIDLLNSLLNITGPDKDLKGADYIWAPLSLPPDYYRASRGTRLKRFLFHDMNNYEHNRLRSIQACRPLTWSKQWPNDKRLLSIRDCVSRILIPHLKWIDETFIPQDRLDAVFHSRMGLRGVSRTLKAINHIFGCNIPLDFVISGEHLFEDFLKQLDKSQFDK